MLKFVAEYNSQKETRALPKFAANLSMLYQEHGFLDRFEAAAKTGFEAVEFLFPYDHAASDIAARLSANGLKQVLFNAAPGQWKQGDRGIAALPGREKEFVDSVKIALDYANELDCPRLHMMAGLIERDGETIVDRNSASDCYVDNLARAAELAAAVDREIVIEPINTRDMPGYFLNYQADAIRLIDRCGAANVRLQFDLYHCQIMEGDLATHLTDLLPRIGHMQIAGVPGRHEPDVGEINYPFLFSEIDRLGYEGYIGCEYRPAADTYAGLGWLSRERDRIAATT